MTETTPKQKYKYYLRNCRVKADRKESASWQIVIVSFAVLLVTGIVALVWRGF